MGPKVVIPDYLGNTRQRDVIGNKLDAASNLPTASTHALLRYIEFLLGSASILALDTRTELPEFSYVNAAVIYSVSVLNRQTSNPILSANLTPGNIDVIRIRAGVETTIHSAVALNKKDGLLYYVISISSANWQEDDTIKVIENTKSTATIGLNTYNVLQIPQACYISDLGDISTQIDQIETDTGLIRGYLEDGGRIDLLLDAIQATCDSIEGKVDVIDTTVNMILSISQWMASGMYDKENPVMLWVSPDMPSTDLGYAVIELYNGGSTWTLPIPPNCTIERWRKGVDVGWTPITTGPCASVSGRIFFPYNFPSTSWATGDLVRVIFSPGAVDDMGKTVILPQQEMYCVVGLSDILQDLADGGRIDLILDSIVQDLSTIITALNIIDTKIDNLQVDVTQILADIATMQIDVTNMLQLVQDIHDWWADGGRLDLILDTIDSNTQNLWNDWQDGGRLDLILDDNNTYIHIIDGKLDDMELASAQILDKTNSQLELSEYNMTFTPGDASDWILYNNSEIKNKKPIVVKLKVANMLTGDIITLTESTRMENGGGWDQVDKETYTGINGGLQNGDVVIEWELTPDRFGTKLVFNQTGGTYRQFKSEAFVEE